MSSNVGQPVFVRLAQIFGPVGSGFVAGLIAACSILGRPLLENLPTELKAKHWKLIYDHGKATAPVAALGACASYAYLASHAYKAGFRSKAKLYVLAALAVSGIIPFTGLVKSSTNSALAALATGSTHAEDSEIMALLYRWIGMNYVRSSLPLLGSVLGLLATLLTPK